MVVPDRAQDARVRRVAGLPLASRSELELLEQDARELLRRAEHELLARELVRLRLELLHAVCEPRGDLPHAVRVDLDARVLHRREHCGERKLDAVVELLAAALAQSCTKRRGEPPRHLGGADRGRGLLLDLGVGKRLDAVLGGEVVELVRGTARLDQIRGDHRVLGGKLREPRQSLVVVGNDLRVADARARARRPRRRRRHRRPARARSARRRSRGRRGRRASPAACPRSTRPWCLRRCARARARPHRARRRG